LFADRGNEAVLHGYSARELLGGTRELGVSARDSCEAPPLAYAVELLERLIEDQPQIGWSSSAGPALELVGWIRWPNRWPLESCLVCRSACGRLVRARARESCQAATEPRVWLRHAVPADSLSEFFSRLLELGLCSVGIDRPFWIRRGHKRRQS
jgi:hypothetical protein